MGILKIIGAIIFIFGLVDFGGSYMDFDLWGKIGISLPDLIWRYSSYIEMGLGGVLFSLGSKDEDEAEE